MDVRESWRRIAAWYARNTPRGLLRLAPGVAPELLDEFEALIGCALPADVRTSFLLHNGSLIDQTFYTYGELADYGELLPLERVAELWQMYGEALAEGDFADLDRAALSATDSAAQIKPLFWSAARIPLTERSEDHLLLDLDPAPAGVVGQIILHERAAGPRAVIAASWAELLSQLADDLEDGRYIFDADAGGVMPLDTLDT